jgi:hypothetical protein
MKNRVESSIITNSEWQKNLEAKMEISLALCMKDIKELLLDKGYLWWISVGTSLGLTSGLEEDKFCTIIFY